jgi:hypothetical protein
MVELKLVHKLLLFIAVILSMVTLSKLFNGDKKEKVEKKVEKKVEPISEKGYDISRSMPISTSQGTIPEDVWEHLFKKAGSSSTPCNAASRMPIARLESTRDEPLYEVPKVTLFNQLAPKSDVPQHVLVGRTSSPDIAISISDTPLRSISDTPTHDRLLFV